MSGIITGTFLALFRYDFDWSIFLLASATTLSLQILSNLANDYGDGVKGTDKGRKGSLRAVESGQISAKSMLVAVVIFSILSLFFGVLLVLKAFGSEQILYVLSFIFLGVAAIVAAIKYTVGKNAYGYSGFGDFFVFIFFGIVSVTGTSFLYSKIFFIEDLLPAIAIGFLSMGVLNLNNLRDYTTDKRSNKRTLVVKMGVGNGKLYHEILLIAAVFSFAVFNYIHYLSMTQFIFLIMAYPLFKHAKRVLNSQLPEDLEPELKTLSLSTLAISTLFGLGLYMSNFISFV
jgi:1,4-dihydroxy-2-naphthoate octaprenyltransferase